MIRLLSMILVACAPVAAEQSSLGVATFEVDATPPLGNPLCHGNVPPAVRIIDRLSARGIVLLSDAKPVVLCAVDWVAIGNGGHDAWRRELAQAAGTSIERVAVHTLHQHDTPGCDFSSEALLAAQGLGGIAFDSEFDHEVITRTAQAVRRAVSNPQPLTHIGVGRARVERVASNRRILGEDGKVEHVRYSACPDEKIRSAPEGLIDPELRLVSFWNGERAVAALTYYATHPQSFYRRGAVSADFVGLARALREATLPQVVHVHFDGAGGNVTAGKYNDGQPGRRLELAERLAEGMKTAWTSMEKHAVRASDFEWRVRPVNIPPREELEEPALRAKLEDPQAGRPARIRAARDLAWLQRCRNGHRIELACLRLGPAMILHMPGELFVEYQLAAQEMRPDRFVCMAAYGDCGTGYIGTAKAYGEGGYETGAPSRVAPAVEAVLMQGMRDLLAK